MRVRLLCSVAALALILAHHVAASAAADSAIGNEAPIAIAVSPLYSRTHMVAAITVPVGGCRHACLHLWTTRDGGATWQRAATTPPGLSLVVVQAPSGGERLVSATANGVVDSDDGGTTWTTVGPPGTPSPAGAPGAVLVAGDGAGDYVLDGDTRHDIPGSGGGDTDLGFAAVQASTSQNVVAMLAGRDHASGLPVVLRCDADLACAGGVPLPGATPNSADNMSVLLPPDLDAGGAAYVRTTTSLYRSDDGGRTFTGVVLPVRAGASYSTVSAAALAPGTRPAVYVALLDMVGKGTSQLTEGGVFASSDRGATWRAVGSPGVLDGGASAVAVAPDGRVFAGYVDGHGAAGLVCSDGGEEWRSSCGMASAAACVGATCNLRGEIAAQSRPTPTVVATTGRNGRSPAGAMAGAEGLSRANVGQEGGGNPDRTIALTLCAATVVPAVLLVTTRRRGRRRRCS